MTHPEEEEKFAFPARHAENKSDLHFIIKMIYLIYEKTTRKRRDSYYDLQERFLKYIAVSTASDEDSTEPGSTPGSWSSRRLAEEMLSLGLKNVHMDSCGNAIGTLPATEGVKAAGTLALVAHVDTAPAANGEA